MPDIFNQVIGDWIDVGGKTATSFMTTQNQSSSGASSYSLLATALQNCSDAALRAIQFQTTLVLANTPSSGPYDTAVDRASLMGNILNTNQPYRISIVGPKQTIFMPDNVTVNMQNPLIVALEAQVMSLLGDSQGNACGPFKRGQRQMARGN